MALFDSIKTSPAKISQHFKEMKPGKKVGLIVLIILIVAVVIALSVFLNQKTYTVLYSGMEPSDTGEVLGLLSEMGMDAKTQGEDTILVEEQQVDEIRLQLAAQGYPSTGVNDYSIYSSASGLGTTDSEKQVYYKYQLQANLRTTIMQMDKVENAVVNLDLGEDSSFVLSSDKKPATASIMLTLKGGQTLGGQEVKAISELVATSVSGLDAENVRIVDSQMNLYSTEDESGIQSVDSRLELQTNVQDQLQEQIVNLLNPVFGEDNVLAEVSAQLNFDEKYSESVEYSTPQGSTEGIVVSMQELVEAITNDADGSVAGIDANGNASEYLATLNESDSAVYYNVSREVNYEINQTTTQLEEAKGEIESLSVSVILNGSYIDDYVDEVKNLIATAVGADVENITVEMLPFTAAAAEEEQSAAAAAQALEFEQQIASSAQGAQTLRLIIVVIAVLAVVIFLFSVIKMLRPKETEMAAEGGIDIMIDDDTLQGTTAKESKEIEINVADSNLSVLEDYIAKNPESAANLLRNWLNEE